MKDREQIAEPFKRENKYLVLKWSDLEKYLPKDRFLGFDFVGYLCDTVNIGRHKDGKMDNTYVVVNEDEPYAEDVWMLIKKGKSLAQLGYTRQPEPVRISEEEILAYARFHGYYKALIKSWDMLRLSAVSIGANAQLAQDQQIIRGIMNTSRFELTGLREKIIGLVCDAIGIAVNNPHEPVAEQLVDDILSMLEPVELKALSDEEIIAEYESRTNLDYDDEYQMKGLKGISQATVQKNQKGQLFRLKEEKDDRPITENR